MFFELCAFQDGIKYGWKDTFGTCRSFGKSAMILSNPSNLQISDETRVLRAWPTYKPKWNTLDFHKQQKIVFKHKKLQKHTKWNNVVQAH